MANEVCTSIEIAATPQNVWAVLADLASYSQWHPVFRSVTGQLEAGTKLTIKTVVPSTGRAMTVKVKVVKAEPGSELQWVSKMLGLPISKRTFLLSPSSGGGTSLVQVETYQGLTNVFGGPGSVRRKFAVVDRIHGTFAAINDAIKEQAEARQQAPS